MNDEEIKTMTEKAVNRKIVGKVVVVNILVLIVIFLLLELLVRAFYPEFVNNITNYDFTLGKRVHRLQSMNQRIRIPYEGYKPTGSGPMFVILGDSISDGYGNAYEDIYWVKLQRKINLFYGGENIRVVSFAQFGNNQDNFVEFGGDLEKLAKTNDVKFFMYQFNYNDVMPFTAHDLKQIKYDMGPMRRSFEEFRYTYLNRSAVVRAVGYLASISPLKRKLHGSCEERGIDALEQYTYAYGSRPFREESLKYWNGLENGITEMAKRSSRLGIKFVILVSPIAFDIDKKGVAPDYNHFRLDFSCGTIDPKERLRKIAAENNILLIDPAEYVREGFEARIKEGNYEPFYFPGESNHFNARASEYVAEYLFKEIRPLIEGSPKKMKR